ncbi:MAG: ferrous iron transport protein A [Candidatus Cloacimonetes bacterium]|nr:ferrous iron transport protein A [Candidatus Cloacimonadota bacterium]
MLNNRNRGRLSRFGRRFMQRRESCPCASGDCLSLTDLPSGEKAIITCNKHLLIIERGLYQGMTLTMHRNDSDEPNVIVAVGDARYVLDRRIAREIRVKIV